jgi:alkylhydroperoxidase family enzyme
MARISYVDPKSITDPEIRQWLEESIRKGRPGPENQAIRAHQPDVMRSFTMTRQWLFHNGVVEHDLKELVRVRIATTLECAY